MNIRDLHLEDLAEVTDIYNYYVLNTAVTFDTDPFSAEQRIPWFNAFEPGTSCQCLVGESVTEEDATKSVAGHKDQQPTTSEAEPKILGYASSAQFRPKPAYHRSVETTIYLHPDAIGQGIGKVLYAKLLRNMLNINIHRAYGIIALPNAASIHLHRNLGFSEIGTFSEVGHKFGRYHDTLWLEKKLN